MPLKRRKLEGAFRLWEKFTPLSLVLVASAAHRVRVTLKLRTDYLLTQALAQAEVQSLLEPALNTLAIRALPTTLQTLRDLLVQGLANVAVGLDSLLCRNMR